MANEFQLGGIVPWGRTAAEYEAFFQLAGTPKSTRILDTRASSINDTDRAVARRERGAPIDRVATRLRAT